MTPPRQKVTPAAIRQQLVGGTCIGPGVWVDRRGDFHISIPDLLKHFGLEDTDANRDELTILAEAIMRDLLPVGEVIVQDVDADG